MIQIQALCRILAKQDYSFIEDNLLTVDDFIGYEAEFNFIVEHYEKYNTIPDEATFKDKFEDFPFIDVTESDAYILSTLREQTLFNKALPVFQEAAELLKTNSNEAVEFIRQKLDLELQPQYEISDEELIEKVDERVANSELISQNPTEWFIPTGFEEIDKEINGFQKGEELVVIFARTNMGKSWVSEKIATYQAEIGYKPGYFSPEMSARNLGYRFDTLHGHLSNNAMRLGRFDDEFSLDDYIQYAEQTKQLKGKLYVTRPKDFAKKVTVSKLRVWAKARKLDALYIDGITYLTDERYRRGDSKTISLTNISEDLMELSSELKIPIIVVVQANRGGVVDKKSLDTPELENIRDSDGIAQNASIVYSVRQVRDNDNNVFLLIDNKKMREGANGKSYKYRWNIDKGEFECVTDGDIDMSDKDEDTPKRERKEPTAGKRRKRKQEDEEF